MFYESQQADVNIYRAHCVYSRYGNRKWGQDHFSYIQRTPYMQVTPYLFIAVN